jgi:hypothetical protein
MSYLRDLLKKNIEKRTIQFSHFNAARKQEHVLVKLLVKARHTSFGETFKFEEILHADNIIKAFQQQVPVGNYTTMHPWWQRSFNGEANVTWPKEVKYFALSSGTSEGSSKFIPVTKQMLRAIRRGSFRQLLAIARNPALPKDILRRDSLMIGGSTELQFNGINYSGDLSGITTSHIPFWFQRFSKPEPEIRALKSWDEKVHDIVLEAGNWDVSMVAGVPAWIQLIFEKIIVHYNLESIHDIWPHLSVYAHGGVAIEPYRTSLQKLFSKPVYFYETYMASEGFFAYQNKRDAKGMKLFLNNGVFFEFIPFNEQNFDGEGNLLNNPQSLTIAEVEADKDYALIISTCSGAWRYMIGDTIRFVSLKNYEIKITGRTKHFLSLCGEHLSVDNMSTALQAVAAESGIISNEFTVAGYTSPEGITHHWYVGCDKPADAEAFKKRLDEELCKINDDYKVERQHALKNLIITMLPNNTFNNFLAENGKQGGQVKFPRVIRNQLYEDWKAFVSKAGF